MITIGAIIILLTIFPIILRRLKQGVPLNLFEIVLAVVGVGLVLVIWVVGDAASIQLRIIISVVAIILLVSAALCSKIRKSFFSSGKVIEVKPMKPRCLYGVANTKEEWNNHKYRCYLIFLKLNIVNKGINWLGLSKSVKDCYAKIKIIGAKDISESEEYLKWERVFSDNERTELYIHSGSLEEYTKKVHGYLEKNPTQTEIRHEEDKNLVLLYALSNQKCVYFGTEHRNQIGITCPPFSIRLSLSGESLRKNLDFKVEIKSLRDMIITPIDC